MFSFLHPSNLIVSPGLPFPAWGGASAAGTACPNSHAGLVQTVHNLSMETSTPFKKMKLSDSREEERSLNSQKTSNMSSNGHMEIEVREP